MNKDQVEGRAKEVAGKIKKNLGHAMRSRCMESEGAASEVVGKIQKTVGDVKRSIAREIDRG